MKSKGGSKMCDEGIKISEKTCERTFQILSKINNAKFALDEYQSKLIGRRSLINYFNTIDMEKQDEAKLLTHWICYIVDRGISYEKVWDVGGFIFSQLAYEFCIGGKDVKDLLECNGEYSFFKSEFIDNKLSRQKQNDSADDVLADNIEENNDRSKANYHFYFQASFDKADDHAKKILRRYGYNEKNKDVKFSSRFYPADYRSIYFTLYSLKKFGGFKVFINNVLKKCDASNKLQKLLFAMYKITYSNVSLSPLIKKEVTKGINENIKSTSKAIFDGFIKILNDNMSTSAEDRWRKDDSLEKLLPEFDKYIENENGKSNVFSSKRAICSIRDFIEIPEFYKSLTNITDHRIDFRPLLKTLELPGDVWNNKDEFWKCTLGFPNILGERSVYKIPPKKNLYIRKVYDNISYTNSNSEDIATPIQFDLTFDFVPRMCDKGNCRICVLNNKENQKEDRNEVVFNKICIAPYEKPYRNNHYCPVLLLYCGYAVPCSESICMKKYFYDKLL